MPITVLTIAAVLLALAVVMLVRTLTFAHPFEPVPPVESIPVDADVVADHLAQVIRCETISVDSETPPTDECLLELRQKLQEMYPLVHAQLEGRLINEHALLYTWPGTAPNLEPILLMAHQDVVPADPLTLSEWECPPFEGRIADGYVWGRGALDNKNQMIAALEAVEALLHAGHRPQRTVYLGFGYDEEIGGQHGAAQIAAWLQEQGVRLKALLDEGGVLIEGLLPGIKGKMALVGTVEKGYVTLGLSVTREPGHSAMPPKQTAIGILGRAIARLEAHPMHPRLAAMRDMVQGIGTAAPFVYRLIFANLWLLGPLVRRMLTQSPKTAAMIRTTTAATVIAGGVKDNILPCEATASVNCRVLPGDHVADILAHAERVIADERVKVEVAEGFFSEPSPVSPTDGPPYQQLTQAIRQTLGNIAVAPYLVVGATDARHYSAVCKHAYRFAPCALLPEDINRVHGINERIAVDDLARMVQFDAQLIKLWASA